MGARTPRTDPRIGRTIDGRYRVTELIGEGGMGQVYRARHLSLETDVCIKVLRAASSDRDAVRFQREALAASRLRSEHSVHVLDSGQDASDGLLYIAMELIDGRSLKQLLAEEFPLGEERICNLMQQVLAACMEAHAQHVIHRDLKPSDIMIEKRRDEPDFAKVLDFGIAKIQEPEFVTLTRTNATCGTPAYMSPEQGLGGELDERSDLYSVGVILSELATGMLPFGGRTTLETLTRHQTDMPMPPRLRRPEVNISPELELLILQTLEKDPAKRPQTAGEFREKILGLRDRLRDSRERRAVSGRPAPSPAPSLLPVPSQEGPDLEARRASRSTASVDLDVQAALAPSRHRVFLGVGLVCAIAIGLGVVWLQPAPLPVPATHPPQAALPSAPVHAPLPAAPLGPTLLPTKQAQGQAPKLAPRETEKARRPVLAEGNPPDTQANVTKTERPHQPGPPSEPQRSSTATRVDPRSGLELVQLAGGTFHYGCEPQDPECMAQEKPGREVSVPAFWLGKTDVTVAAYRKCVHAGSCTAPKKGGECNWRAPGKDSHPINCIDWDQANTFCQWMGGRLPTSEEWEYAAKGGGSRIYPWGDDAVTGKRANFCDAQCKRAHPAWIWADGSQDDGWPETSPVGVFPAGATRQGLLDMAGNVYQWTATSHDARTKETRGGSWHAGASGLRASNRGKDRPSARDGHLGARCALGG